MNEREKVVIRIMLLVAKWIAPSEYSRDIEQLASHISVNMKVSV